MEKIFKFSIGLIIIQVICRISNSDQINEIRSCGVNDCLVNGNWSEYGNWSRCPNCWKDDELLPTRNRLRSCNNLLPKHGGNECIGDWLEVEVCTNLIDCSLNGNWSEWTEIESCSKSCLQNKGDTLSTKTLQRICNSPAPTNGGLPCVGYSTKVEYCNLTECQKYNTDGWSQWSADNECPNCWLRLKDSNTPKQILRRTCMRTGEECVGPNENILLCSIPDCLENQTVICPNGYEFTTRNNMCSDVDECAGDPNICDSVSFSSKLQCVNTRGSFECKCPNDYVEVKISGNYTHCKKLNSCNQQDDDLSCTIENSNLLNPNNVTCILDNSNLSTKTIHVMEHNELVIQCVGEGIIYLYIDSSLTLVPNQFGNTLVYIIENFTSDDTAQYTCEYPETKNPDQTINVKLIRPEVIENRNIDVIEGDSITIKCENFPVKSRRSVFWTLDGRKLAKYKYNIFNENNTSICIENVKKEDHGNYTCLSMINGILRSASSILNVLYPVYIQGISVNEALIMEKDKFIVFGKDNDTIHFKCLVDGNPNPETWIILNSERHENNISIRMKTNTSMLLKCSANNKWNTERVFNVTFLKGCDNSSSGDCPTEITDITFFSTFCEDGENNCVQLTTTEDKATTETTDLTLTTNYIDCNMTAFGCCDDGITPAHGRHLEGCCLNSPFGCCPDKKQSALGLFLEGCDFKFVPPGCVDNEFFSNCNLIVKYNYCTHKYYGKFCCKSCYLAGLLSAMPQIRFGCQQPEDAGPCDDWVIRYAYNSTSQECNGFYYGGCDGNGNRFISEAECESTCITQHPAEPEVVHEPDFSSKDVKPGECPVLSNATVCEYECHTDGNCHGDKKCCTAGCSTSCVPPAEDITVAPLVYHGHEEHQPRAPVLKPVPKSDVDVVVHEGGLATLRCFADGYPPPAIQWKRDGLFINTNRGRYVLNSDGDLQIVQVHQTDSGVYVCVADNGIGAPVQREVELSVNDPKDVDAYIAGEQNTTQIVTLGRPASIQCAAGGIPQVHVSWWRGKNLLPYSGPRFSVEKDYSLSFNCVDLSDLGVYLCEAYSGYGKPSSKQVTLMTHGPVEPTNEDDRNYLQFVIDPVSDPYGLRARPPAPEIVPVTAHIHYPSGHDFVSGGDIVLKCEVSGDPTPRVEWLRNGNKLEASDRVRISNSHELVITKANADDSGFYKCNARNKYDDAHHAVEISIKNTLVPADCVDNQFFANCILIVNGNYCTHKYYTKFCCRSCTLAGQL